MDFNEEEREQTFRLYDDTVLYEVSATKNAKGFLLQPKSRVPYTLRQGTDGAVEYLENGDIYPLKLSGDSAFTFQHMGYRFIYVRAPGEAAMRKAIINAFCPDSEGRYNGYQMTDTQERTLEKRYETLLWVVSTSILLLIGAVGYTFSSIRHKRKMEQKLQQLNDELRLRPQYISEMLRTAKEDFERSEYYLQLHRRITRGEYLSEDDWREMEQQVKKAYPDFINNILTLIPLSEVEFRTCMLIRLSVPPTNMAEVLHRDLSSISTIRSRLYGKVFGKKGSSHDWDDFILSL